MTFNPAKATALATKLMTSKTVEALVLGQSGAGKSYVMGTFGVPTLYLYTTGESHGPRVANRATIEQETGGSIIPVCFDLDDDGVKLEGDAVISRIMEVINDTAFIDSHKIGAIVLDGAAEIENYIRGSETYRLACRTKEGHHNSFAEGAVTCTIFRPIFNRLKDLQRTHGMHFAVAAMLDVKEYGEMNDVAVATPTAKGYQVAVMLLQQFGDVLVVGPMKKDGETKWKFQFMTDLHKVSTDLKTKMVKRAINFNPRVDGPTPPPYMPADFRAFIAHKTGK